MSCSAVLDNFIGSDFIMSGLEDEGMKYSSSGFRDLGRKTWSFVLSGTSSTLNLEQ